MKEMGPSIYKGHVVFTKTKDQFTILENGYILVTDGKVQSVFSSLPEAYHSIPVKDFGDRLMIPGFVDLHLHAPQYPNKALCLDAQLMEWLFQCTLPQEAKYQDLNYAKMVYTEFIKELWQVGTTRAVINNTLHERATRLLLDMYIQSGLGAFIGKVNMDINTPDYLSENTYESLYITERILMDYHQRSPLVKPIIAPRFVPACSPQLMLGLGQLARKYGVPVTSHLSEDLEEIRLVHKMYPTFPTYGSIYEYFGLFGQQPTVMAHSIYSSDEEIELIRRNGVYIAHCPSSNCHLASGMMPLRKFIDRGVNMGLASDVAGGTSLSMLEAMAYTIATSKMVWLYSGQALPPLKTSEAFYLATKGGGSFFGRVGSFEKGYEFDALVIDDSNLNLFDYSLEERITRFIYLGDDRNIVERYVAGKKVDEPQFL